MTFRVHVPLPTYAGSDVKKRARAVREAQLCEEIRAELQRRYDEDIPPGETRAIVSHQVAYAINRDPEEVRKVMMRIQGGSNGVTFSKPADPNYVPPPPPAKPPSEAGTKDGKILLGARVAHAKFGVGDVTHIEGDRLEISFDSVGVKRVIASFVRSESD